MWGYNQGLISYDLKKIRVCTNFGQRSFFRTIVNALDKNTYSALTAVSVTDKTESQIVNLSSQHTFLFSNLISKWSKRKFIKFMGYYKCIGSLELCPVLEYL